jgi:hypothetical protein
MRYVILLLALVACGDVPQGVSDEMGFISGVPDGVTFTGAGAILMAVVNFLLKLLSMLSKVAPLMAKRWFRVLVPAATLGLSAAVWITLAAMGQVKWADAVNALLGMGMSAIAWWELVGQHLFTKPKDRAPAPEPYVPTVPPTNPT